MDFYFCLDGNGNIMGSGATPDGTFPLTPYVECTPEQAAVPGDWKVVDGKVVAANE